MGTYFEDSDKKLFFNVIEDNDPTDTYEYSDGDDYMEGNGGNDRMYGNLGQDDMIGGSSTLFGLAKAIAGTMPDGELGGVGNEVQQITLLNAPFYGGNNGEPVRTYRLAFGGEITETIEFGADASVVRSFHRRH